VNSTRASSRQSASRWPARRAMHGPTVLPVPAHPAPSPDRSSVDPRNFALAGWQKHPPLLRRAEEHGFRARSSSVITRKWAGSRGVCRAVAHIAGVDVGRPLARSKLLITASIVPLPSARRMRPSTASSWGSHSIRRCQGLVISNGPYRLAGELSGSRSTIQVVVAAG